MKATLTIEIEFDPEVTDDESVASALDTLLETAMSTPEIFEEYGNPTVGEFLILDAKVENFYPDVDAINVTVGDINVNVSRDEHGDTHVAVVAPETRTDLVLGQEGETQKV
jgi:hypothetical protein